MKAYLATELPKNSLLIVEADAQDVVQVLNHEINDSSDIKVVVNEVEVLAAEALVISFAKCLRKGNRIAHSLARAAAGYTPMHSLSSAIVDGSSVLVGLGNFGLPSVLEEANFCRDDISPF